MLISFAPSPITSIPLAEAPSGFEALPDTETEETLEEATRRIAVRYEAMERLASRLIAGKLPSLIISGPPGLGKSYTLDVELHKSQRQRHDGMPINDASNWYDRISGGCTAPGLYHALWNMRNGGVLLIDDCDSVFADIEALNLIKIATDSSKERNLNWRKRAAWLDQYEIDKSFDFRGHICFITNIDFETIIQKQSRDVEHYKALIDRAHYLCLTLRTQRDFMIRIHAVTAGESGMLQRIYGLSAEQAECVLDFVEENKMRFYNLSIRLVAQIAQTMLADPENWRNDIEATKMRTQ